MLLSRCLGLCVVGLLPHASPTFLQGAAGWIEIATSPGRDIPKSSTLSSVDCYTMASSRTPLLTNDHPDSDDEETALLGGFITTSSSRPFATDFNPTLTTRSLALILAIPAFIIFVVHGPHYAAPITFLSFAIARQVAVLGSHVGSEIAVIKFEVIHPSVSERTEEIKKGIAGIIDGVILLGLLISLSVAAHEVDTHYLPATVTHAVILGFIVLWVTTSFKSKPKNVD